MPLFQSFILLHTLINGNQRFSAILDPSPQSSVVLHHQRTLIFVIAPQEYKMYNPSEIAPIFTNSLPAWLIVAPAVIRNKKKEIDLNSPILILLVALWLSGCSSKQLALRDLTTSISAFRQNLEIPKTILDQYSITLKERCIVSGPSPVYRRGEYHIEFRKKDEPTCYIDLRDEYLILELKYIRPIDILGEIINLPVALLASLIGEKKRSQYGINQLGVYRSIGSKYLGSIYTFQREEYNEIVVKTPFESNFTREIAISVPKFYYPRSAPRIEYVGGINDEVIFQVLSKEGFKNVIIYALKTREDTRQNERLLMDAIKFDREIFLEAKRAEGIKINSAILSFPDDADTIYLSENFGKSIGMGKYKSIDGSFKKINIGEKESGNNDNPKYKAKEYNIEHSRENIEFKDAMQQNQKTYIDFSKGI